MSVVKDVLKRHDDIFDIIEPTTINLDGFPFNMCPVLRFTEDGISLSCPIAYYVTDEQRDLILVFVKRIKPEYGIQILDGGHSSVKPMKAVKANQLFCRRESSLMLTMKNY